MKVQRGLESFGNYDNSQTRTAGSKPSEVELPSRLKSSCPSILSQGNVRITIVYWNGRGEIITFIFGVKLSTWTVIKFDTVLQRNESFHISLSFSTYLHTLLCYLATLNVTSLNYGSSLPGLGWTVGFPEVPTILTNPPSSNRNRGRNSSRKDSRQSHRS